MADYGLTPQGPNIKRLDVILEEMHSGLSEKWGVNTRQNPESLLNHLLTNVADAIADLWEFGEAVYFSQYPATAEGRSLDNAAQYGGSTREAAAKSYYPIHCTGKDGTKLAAGTRISSATNPTTYLMRQLCREPFARWLTCRKLQGGWLDGNCIRPNVTFRHGKQTEKVRYDDWNETAAYSDTFNPNFREG